MAKDKSNGIVKKSILTEAICIAIIAASIIGVISMFGGEGSGGPIGSSISWVLTRLFGQAAYLLPLFAIYFSILIFLRRRRKISLPIIIMGAALFLMLPVAVHVFGSHDVDIVCGCSYDVCIYNYRNCGEETRSRGMRSGLFEYGGGLIGMLFGWLFMLLLGTTGARILVVAAIIVLAMFVTGKSFFNFVGNVTDRVRSYREDNDKEDDEEDEKPTKSKDKPQNNTPQKTKSNTTDDEPIPNAPPPTPQPASSTVSQAVNDDSSPEG